MEVTDRVVQLTGFRDTEREELITLICKLPCKYIDSEKYEHCTHLIAEKPCRSEKWLAACAAGKWVLTKEYVINSAASGRWLDETTFEWGYKMESDSHYLSSLQSAPKRWREHLTHTGAAGAFSRWKVTLLIDNADKEREAFLRVLTAGNAVLCSPDNSDEGITHVFTNNNILLQDNRTRSCKTPYYSVLYLGKYLLEVPIESAPLTDEEIASLKSSIWKHFCVAQACHHRCTEKHNGHYERHKVKNVEIGRASLNRIEELIEGQFFTEAYGEMEHFPSAVFPQKFFILLLKHFLQGNVDINYYGRFFGIFCNLLHHHPPWESNYMMQYYFNVLQCPICKKGTWSFIECIIRCFLEDRLCLCHETIDLEIDSNKRRKIVATILKFVASVMQEEAKALSRKLCECPDSSTKTLLPSFIVGIFWPETRTMVFLTKNMCVLTDLVIKCYKKMSCRDGVFFQEISASLNGMLAAVVEYWILLGFYLNKNLLQQVARDFVFYVCVSCSELTMLEKKQFICCIASSWLQMFIAEAMFTNHYIESNIKMSPEPLSLHKLIYTYIPSSWKMGACGTDEGQKLGGKRKIGQRPCLQSQRALLMLNGENQNQGDVLLDLPIVSKLRRKTDHGSGSRDLVLQQVNGLPSKCQNRKGETTLHKACRTNNIKKLRLHLDLHGTDINVKDNAGWTPLHEACNHGSTECVREILQRCPEVDLLSHVDGVTPLHDALQNGHMEIGKMLLQYGGPVLLQHKDSSGKFPLDYIYSPQLKNEMFQIVHVKETIEDFHKQAAETSDSHELEFRAFLLSRMLLNFVSLYGLPSDTLTAQTLFPNAALLVNYAKKTSTSFRNSVVESFIEGVAVMHRLCDFMETIPKSVIHNPGFHMQVLLSVLRVMSSSSLDSRMNT